MFLFQNKEEKFASVLKLCVKELYNSNPALNQYLITVRFIESKLRVYIKDLNCKRFRVKWFLLQTRITFKFLFWFQYIRNKTHFIHQFATFYDILGCTLMMNHIENSSSFHFEISIKICIITFSSFHFVYSKKRKCRIFISK